MTATSGMIAILNGEPTVVEAIADILRKAGYEVVCPEEGGSPLGLLNQVTPDLIILDLQATEVSGYVLLDIIRAKGLKIPVLVLTTPELITDSLAQQGIAGLLIKPVHKQRLLLHVQAILDVQRATAACTTTSPVAAIVDEPTPQPLQRSAAPSTAWPSPAKAVETQPPISGTPPVQPVTEVAPQEVVHQGIPEPEGTPVVSLEPEVKQGPVMPVPSFPVKSGYHAKEKPTILVVDDEPDMQSLLSDLLVFSGFEVVTAGDGVEGLKLAQQHNPDAILLDIMLPKLDGFQMCRLLKFNEKYREIPVVMLTARNHPKDRDLAEGSGADGYIVKPFETKSLLEQLWRVIRAREGNH